MSSKDERPISVVPPELKRPKPGDPIVWKEGVDAKPCLLVELRPDGDALVHLDSAPYGDNDVAAQDDIFLPRPPGSSGRRRRAFPSASAVSQRSAIARRGGRNEAEQPEPETEPVGSASVPPPEPPPDAEATDEELPDQPPAVAVPATAIVFEALRMAAQRQIDRAQRVLDAVDDLEKALEASD